MLMIQVLLQLYRKLSNLSLVYYYQIITGLKQSKRLNYFIIRIK